MMDSIIASISAIAGFTSIAKTIYDYKKDEKTETISIQFSGKMSERIEIPADIPAEDLKKLLKKLSQIDKIEEELERSKPKNQAGFVLSEFFIYIVPGIIALLFAGTFVYLLLINRQNPDYTSPKELSSAMTMIIGYFFGVGVSAAANKGKSLSKGEIKRLISN